MRGRESFFIREKAELLKKEVMNNKDLRELIIETGKTYMEAIDNTTIIHGCSRLKAVGWFIRQQLFFGIKPKEYHENKEFYKKVGEALNKKDSLAPIILTLLSEGPLSPKEIHSILSIIDHNISMGTIKWEINYLKKKGIIVESFPSHLSINYYYSNEFEKMLERNNVKTKLFIIIIYNYLSLQRLDSVGFGWVWLGLQKIKQIFNIVNNNKNHKNDKKIDLFSEAKKTAENILGRELEIEESLVIKVLLDHYQKTQQLWMSPEDFQEAIVNEKISSSSIYRNVITENVVKAVHRLASYGIAYAWRVGRKTIKVALYKSFLEEVVGHPIKTVRKKRKKRGELF